MSVIHTMKIGKGITIGTPGDITQTVPSNADMLGNQYPSFYAKQSDVNTINTNLNDFGFTVGADGFPYATYKVGADTVTKKLGSSLLAYSEGTAVTAITVPNDVTNGILVIRGSVENTTISVNGGTAEIIDSNTLSCTVSVSSASFGVYNPVTYKNFTGYIYEIVVRLSDIPKDSIITLSKSNSYLLFS